MAEGSRKQESRRQAAAAAIERPRRPSLLAAILRGTVAGRPGRCAASSSAVVRRASPD